jgi:hypothetical protein
MNFTKNSLKRFAKTLSRTDCIVRSLYGVIPHDDFVKEKISGINSFFKEPQNRKIFNHINIKDYHFMRSFIEMNVSSHFTKIQNENLGESCMIVCINKNLNDSQVSVVYDNEELIDNPIYSDENVLIVLVHFLPYEAAIQYEECSRSSYNISFANKFSFGGSKFMATIRVEGSSMPNAFARNGIKSYDMAMCELRETLTGKFNGVETITESVASKPMIKGFRIYYDELSRVNVLKLINIKVKYTIDITSSLSSLGMVNTYNQAQ